MWVKSSLLFLPKRLRKFALVGAWGAEYTERMICPPKSVAIKNPCDTLITSGADSLKNAELLYKTAQ